MNPILVICGPTATGKTALALRLAKQFHGDLLSVDSRQLYKGMDIGTGKDIPPNLIGLTLYGYDLVDPDQPFSAVDFYQYAWPVVKTIWSHERLPILVGGTGLYLKTLFQPPPSAGVPINISLRTKLNRLSLLELQARLRAQDLLRWTKMNLSDQNNPRRLIRAIEIANFSRSKIKTLDNTNHFNSLWLGLTADQDVLKNKIAARVKARSTSQFSQEVQILLHTYPEFFSFPASSATGYREWHQHLQGKISSDEATKLWINRENQYAKRQLTWFKKQSQIHWYDLSQPRLYQAIAQRVETWYPKYNARESRPSPNKFT